MLEEILAGILTNLLCEIIMYVGKRALRFLRKKMK